MVDSARQSQEAVSEVDDNEYKYCIQIESKTHLYLKMCILLALLLVSIGCVALVFVLFPGTADAHYPSAPPVKYRRRTE